MWPFKKKAEPEKNKNESASLRWLPVCAENPFDHPILDIRSITLNMVSTTKDPSVAENFSKSRQSQGREFIGKNPTEATSFDREFSYLHNGEELDGVVFKSPTMEVKWDIYAYGEWFYFVRSWTSDLIYKARYENTGAALVIREIVSEKQATEEDAQNVHSIMLTHALGRVWPFHIPSHLRELEPRNIALNIFSQFGSKATIITNANIFDIQLLSE